MGKGVAGLILRARRADDHVFTVLSAEAVTQRYHRIRFDGGGFLARNPWFPTMWVRLWVPRSGEASPDADAGSLIQRGYTIVAPHGSQFDIEFAVHDGPAARWALDARAGDRIGATMMGAELTVPPAPSEYLLVGDAASIPAINSLLDEAAAAGVPHRVFLEYQHDAERAIPVHGAVTWVPREDRGATLVGAVTRAGVPADAFLFVAAETRATREITRAARRDFGLPAERIKSQAYWLQRG